MYEHTVKPDWQLHYPFRKFCELTTGRQNLLSALSLIAVAGYSRQKYIPDKMCDSNYVYTNLYSNMTIIKLYMINGQLSSINNSNY